MYTPSIFNDVLGPVMRGPSSSHSAAALRIGRVAKDLMGGEVNQVDVRFDLNGSLPTTYLTQGSAMGLGGGLLGFSADDPRLINYQDELAGAGIRIDYQNGHYGDTHPNTYNLELNNKSETHRLVALSTGGGMIEVVSIDGLEVQFQGDRYGLLVWASDELTELRSLLRQAGSEVLACSQGDSGQLMAASSTPYPGTLLAEIQRISPGSTVRLLEPVLPVVSLAEQSLPFQSASEMTSYARNHGLADLAQLAIAYESARGGLSAAQVLEMSGKLVDIVELSIREGLAGTVYADRILGSQSGSYLAAKGQGRLLPLGVLDTAISYVTALMEIKSSMGVIVAAPTAGSCGGMPGSVIALGDSLHLGREDKARGLLAAGLIGAFIATRSTFAAEVCGCQAECGVSSGMVAAAAVTMQGGGFQAGLAAASMALQNCFGMVCDPVGNRVEVPCLGKNILAATNGITAANLATAGFDHVIPFDEVVVAMDQVGRSLPHELRCTALGGLAITPTSKAIFNRLAGTEKEQKG